jgi:GGDEF domain-containing protein
MLSRHGLAARFAELSARAARAHVPISLVLVDVDEFKSVNDERGHAAGDAVLEHVAATLAAGLRSFDLAYRIGGDEFAVILPGVPVAEVAEVADRLRREVVQARPGGLPVTLAGRNRVETAGDDAAAPALAAGPARSATEIASPQMDRQLPVDRARRAADEDAVRALVDDPGVGSRAPVHERVWGRSAASRDRAVRGAATPWLPGHCRAWRRARLAAARRQRGPGALINQGRARPPRYEGADPYALRGSFVSLLAILAARQTEDSHGRHTRREPGRVSRDLVLNPAQEAKPTGGLEPPTPSLRVMCSTS